MIALDSASKFAGDTTVVTSVAWNHTCTGSNLVLVVLTAAQTATDANRPIDSVTYNGDALTKIREDDNAGDNITTGIWYLLNPDTGGAYEILVTAHGLETGLTAMAYSLTGVAQSGQPDAQNGTTGSNAASVSTTVTTVADNSWVLGICVMIGVVGTITDASSQSNTQTSLNFEMSTADAGTGTLGPKTPAGDVAVSWDDGGATGSPDWAISAASFSPFGARRIFITQQ